MIAMALVLEPALLIADEPTTALDVTTQAQILQLIKDIQREHGTAVLFITHDFGVVAEIADRVAVMQWGKVVEAGETEQLLQTATSLHRMLIGSVPGLAPRHRERAAAPDVVLRTVDLTKVYGGGWFQRREVRAAERVNVEVRRGETLGIVGESGSGKTTVARCIARLIDPPRVRSGSKLRRSGSSRHASCARTAGASRSYSRTPTARSTRAARSVPRSSRGL